MRTVYYVLGVDGSWDTRETDWPADPGFDFVKTFLSPLLGGGTAEHVLVLYEGRQADMFVAEIGRLDATTRPAKPRNHMATSIFRQAWATYYPDIDAETLPWIAGDVVLFERRVWK